MASRFYLCLAHMKFLIIISLLMVTALPSVYATIDVSDELKDSLIVTQADTTRATAKKHPWLAGLEIVGFNTAMVGFNRIFNKDEPWSYVTINTIKHNITHKYWAWDQDDLGMNAFRHPVHGMLYYLVSRANGMSFAESSLYTLGGSWMWEIFCEDEEPSINDMVYTTIGGITVGETLWRCGKCLINMVKKGGQRKMSVPFSTSLLIGFRSFKGHGTNALCDIYITWDAKYGDLFDSEKSGPFDNFDISGTIVTGQKTRLVSQARIDNQLWSRSITDEPQKKMVAGIYNHFDFIRVTPLEKSQKESHVPTSFSYSEVGAIGPGIAYRVGRHTLWEQQLYVNGIMMGATTEFDYHKDSRGYSFGSGYGARLYSSLTVGEWLRMGVRAQCSHLFTWDGFYEDEPSRTRIGRSSIQGETGNALTAIVAPTVEVRLMKYLSLQGSGQFMHTHLNYKYHPHTSTHAWEWQMGVKYTIHNR